MKCFNCRSELPDPTDHFMVRCASCRMEYTGDLLRETDPQVWAAILNEDGYELVIHEGDPPSATIYTVAS